MSKDKVEPVTQVDRVAQIGEAIHKAVHAKGRSVAAYQAAVEVVTSYAVHLEARVQDLEVQMENLLMSLQIAAEMEQEQKNTPKIITLDGGMPE